MFRYPNAEFPTWLSSPEGVFSGVVISQDFLQLLDLAGRNRTALLGTVAALYDVGCCIGSITAYWLGERLGRRDTILVGTIVMSIGALLQVSSYSVGQMIAGRIITGIGNGIHTYTEPFKTSMLTHRSTQV